ncbi:MAG: hypothetical protein SFZ02_12250 [bacterium]|nr:hypothetical protein [bacterium]
MTDTYLIQNGGGIASALGCPDALTRLGVEWQSVTSVLPNEGDDQRRLIESAEKLYGKETIRIGVVMTPLEMFTKVKFLGNSRIDPCSAKLKREPLKKFIEANYDPAHTVLVFGITGVEQRRIPSIEGNWGAQGYRTLFPLRECMWDTRQWMDWCYEQVGFVPEPYRQGFDHNNCGTACCKAGVSHWKRVLYKNPHVYAEWEEGEQLWQETMGKDNTMLSRTRDGVKSPLSLRQLREETQAEWADYLPGVHPYSATIIY